MSLTDDDLKRALEILEGHPRGLSLSDLAHLLRDGIAERAEIERVRLALLPAMRKLEAEGRVWCVKPEGQAQRYGLAVADEAPAPA